MMTLLIFFCLALGTIFTFFRTKKSGRVLLLVGLLLFILVGCGLLTSVILSSVESPATQKETIQWAKHNAIILLGAGTVKLPQVETIKPTLMAYSRITETANQYQSCKKSSNNCTVIISGGDALHTGLSEAESYRDVLTNLGVNPKDMVLEKNSLNTYQNAQFTGLILKSEKFDRIILVTSAIHLKRALLYFSYMGFHPIPVASDYLSAQLSFLPLGYNFAITDFAVHEWIGVIRLWVYDLLGLNKKPARP